MDIRIKDLKMEGIKINDTVDFYFNKAIGLFTIDKLENNNGKWFRAEYRKSKQKEYIVAGDFSTYMEAYDFLNEVWKDRVLEFYLSVYENIEIY